MIAELARRRCHALLLDSDELRSVLTPDPSYSRSERDWFYGVIGYWAAWLAGNGLNVFVAATGNRRSYRDDLRHLLDHFAEVHVRCAPRICRERDPKGIYARADQGDARTVPGRGVDYEAPLHPEATVETDTASESEAIASLCAQLEPFLAPFCPPNDPGFG